MKTRFTLLFLVFSVIFSVTSFSQGYILRRAINRQIEKEIDTVLDKKVQEEKNNAREQEKLEREQAAAKAPENTETKAAPEEKEQSQPQVNFGGLFGSKVNIKHKDEYSFSSRIYMVSETYDNKDVMKMDFYMFYSDTSPVLGVETSTITNEKGEGTPVKAVMVMDGENKAFLMLTDANEMKMGIISPMPDENTANTEQKTTPPTFTKTGNTRVIAGYKCDEYAYKINEDKTTGKVWFTKDANLKIDKRGWKNSGMDKYYGNPAFNEGIILANEAYDSKGKLTMKSETKEINPNFPHSISIKGYSLTQMDINQGKKK